MAKIKITDNPWMQNQISSTNGKHYKGRIDNIKYYPEYTLPVPRAKKADSIMLEIGPGWGRWLVAGARKGYIPVGLDHNIWHAKSALKTLEDFGVRGYAVISDLQNLPFKPFVFDLVWSFSAIQHSHYKKAISCLHHINRILKSTGFAYLEFPNKKGIRNRLGPVNYLSEHIDNEDHMAVRYYTISEYEKMFEEAFGSFETHIHSLIGIGVLPEDIKYVKGAEKLKVIASLLGTSIAKFVPGAKYIADSLYFKAKTKHNNYLSDHDARFIDAHNVGYSNLNVIHLLHCPITQSGLTLSEDKKFLISKEAGRKFPIEDNIPVLLVEKSVGL